MDVHISSVSKPGYLLIESTGSVDSANDLLTHSQLIYGEAIKQEEKKILVNSLGTRFPKQFFSYVELVDHYVEDFPDDIKSFKVATVILEEYNEVGTFWETISVNRGLQFHSFTNMDAALNWLLDRDDSTS